MPETGKDDGRILCTFAMCDLHAAGVEETRMSTQLGKTGFHRIPGTGGLLKKHHKHGLVRQIVGRLTHGKFFLQV